MKFQDIVFMLIVLLLGFLCFVLTKDGWAMGCFLGCVALDICYTELISFLKKNGG